MADRIAIMSEGKFRQVGHPKEIYETPVCRFVADFIGNVNLFDGTLAVDQPDHCVIDTGVGRFYVGHGVTGSLGMPVSVAVRPEKISLHREAPANDEFNCLRGEITASGYFGSFSRYRVELAGGARLQVLITHSDRHAELFENGEPVFATCDPESLVVLNS
jgi:putrescine transport system ATP-binding protein